MTSIPSDRPPQPQENVETSGIKNEPSTASSVELAESGKKPFINGLPTELYTKYKKDVDTVRNEAIKLVHNWSFAAGGAFLLSAVAILLALLLNKGEGADADAIGAAKIALGVAGGAGMVAAIGLAKKRSSQIEKVREFIDEKYGEGRVMSDKERLTPTQKRFEGLEPLPKESLKAQKEADIREQFLRNMFEQEISVFFDVSYRRPWEFPKE